MSGAGNSAVGHWWLQRLTSVALIPMGLWLVWVSLSVAGLEHAAASAFMGRPINAVMIVATTVVSAWHAILGIQVILEDYVPAPGTAGFLNLLTRLACLAAILAAAWVAWQLSLGAGA